MSVFSQRMGKDGGFADVEAIRKTLALPVYRDDTYEVMFIPTVSNYSVEGEAGQAEGRVDLTL
jgi:hypothetical protein